MDIIELPVITRGLQIGLIDLDCDEIQIINNIDFRCTSTIECCSTLRIPVTSYDIQRIEEHGFELDQIIESLSPIILPYKTISGTSEKIYSLKRKPYVDSCTFLEDNLCKIHKFKPFTCRIYPFVLEVIDENKVRVVIHTDKLCDSIKTSNIENSNTLEILQSIKSELQYELSRRIQRSD